MERVINVGDFAQYRRLEFNPIFDLITNEFDNVFLEKSLSLETVIQKFYVNKTSDTKIFTLFARGENTVTATDDFTIHGAADGSIYLLHGKKGMGKTTFLYNFYSKASKGKIEGIKKTDLLIYLDLRDYRSDEQYKENMPASLIEQIFYWIYGHSNSYKQYLVDPNYTRKISPLYKYLNDQDISKRVLEYKSEILHFLFSWLKSRGTKVFLIVDNLDDFDRNSIIKIFDLCHRLKTEHSVKSCLALRDYWNFKNLKIDDKTICTLTLSPPDVFEIAKKRIYSIDHNKINHGIEFIYNGVAIELSVKDLLDIFNKIIEELSTPKYHELFNKLQLLTNYNTREFLVNIYYYFHSPYLFAAPNFTTALAAKIKEHYPEYQSDLPRELKLHDFLQGFMAIHSLCIDSEKTTIFNVFHHDYTYQNGFNYRNVLIFIRILQIMLASNKETEFRFVLDQLMTVGYEDLAIYDAIDKMLKAALLESVDGIDSVIVSTIKLTSKGRLYLEEVMLEYTYLLYIADAVPMETKYHIPILKKFGNEAIIFQRGNLGLKHESVRKFIDFIKDNEIEEYEACPKDFIPVLRRIKKERNIYADLQDRAEKTIRYMTALSKRHKHYGITSYHIKS
jgi:hypothetical protein